VAVMVAVMVLGHGLRLWGLRLQQGATTRLCCGRTGRCSPLVAGCTGGSASERRLPVQRRWLPLQCTDWWPLEFPPHVNEQEGLAPSGQGPRRVLYLWQGKKGRTRAGEARRESSVIGHPEGGGGMGEGSMGAAGLHAALHHAPSCSMGTGNRVHTGVRGRGWVRGTRDSTPSGWAVGTTVSALHGLGELAACYVLCRFVLYSAAGWLATAATSPHPGSPAA
jgi:hypothetical protein